LRYTHLLLDADGTLYDFEGAQAQALESTFKQFDLAFQESYIEEFADINGELWERYEQGELLQAQVVVERFEQLFSAHAIRQDPGGFNRQYLENLADCHDILPGAAEAVTTLYGKVHMAILTNGLSMVQRRRLSRSPLGKYFEALIISEEVGVGKPDKGIFEAAYEIMGKPPKEKMLMVGDSLNADIRGANNFGIDACWVNPRWVIATDGIVVDYEIRKLGELLDIVLPA
jgi:2-haloacid dehalogenase